MTDEEKFQKALILLDQLIELFPYKFEYYFERGITYGDLKKYDEAIADYTKVIELNPNDSAAYENHGNDYYELKKYDETIADYTKLIDELKTDSSTALTAYYQREFIYQKLKKSDKSSSNSSEVDKNRHRAYDE